MENIYYLVGTADPYVTQRLTKDLKKIDQATRFHFLSRNDIKNYTKNFYPNILVIGDLKYKDQLESLLRRRMKTNKVTDWEQVDNAQDWIRIK